MQRKSILLIETKNNSYPNEVLFPLEVRDGILKIILLWQKRYAT